MNTGAFCDPKIFRYENKWFMVIAGGPLRIYSSDNLVDWKVESTYAGLHTECPDLYPLAVTDENGEKTGEVKWVLDRGGRKYKIGDFKEVDGKWSFVPDSQYASTNAEGMGNEDNDGIMNFGSDSYAAMTYYMGDFGTKENFKEQDIIAINWMNTWDSGFNNTIPDKNGNTIFNGTYNLQLQYGITQDEDGKCYLTQTPIEQYKTLRDTENKVTLKNAKITENNELFSDFNSDSYEIVVNVKPSKNTTEVGFKVRTGDDEETVVKYSLDNDKLTIDRLKSGILSVDGQRINVTSQTVKRNEDGSIDFDIFVDRSSVEVFSKDYTVAGAMQIFPSPLSQGLEVYSIGGKSKGNITVYPMKTIWKDKLTPTKALGVGLNKTEITGYVGNEFTLNGWLTPSGVEQDIVYTVDNTDVVEVKQEGQKATIIAKGKGNAVITAKSESNPDLKKECKVTIYENNFKTNLTDFEVINGNWYVDGESYIGNSNDNAFLFANKINSDSFKYEVDATYESGILNFIFQSKTKNVWDGCYSLQLNGNTVRLFDFKNDYTFTSVNNLQKPEDNKYHVEIVVNGNTIKAIVNGQEYINHTITEEDRQYTEGYVGLGLFNAKAYYENFYVTMENPPITKITSEIEDITVKKGTSIETIKAQLPETVKVAGDDNIEKEEPVAITWDLSKVNTKKAGTYTAIGTIEGGITTEVNIIVTKK